MQEDASPLNRRRSLVLLLAQEGMAEQRELSSDLVLDARFEGNLQETGVFESVQNPKMRDGSTAVAGGNRIHSKSSPVLGEVMFEPSLIRLDAALNRRDVSTFRRVVLELRAERGGGSRVASEGQEARHLLIQSMDSEDEAFGSTQQLDDADVGPSGSSVREQPRAFIHHQKSLRSVDDHVSGRFSSIRPDGPHPGHGDDVS